ncbi:MAG: signal peptide peptidase SppA [Bacteroidota bacterium]|nr:signal peptide peptidase SppA [Bacteroidota bacterium]
MRFLKNVLATIVGLFLFFAILFFGFLILGMIIGAGGDSSQRISVKDNSVIYFDIDDIAVDHTPEIIIKDFPMFNESNPTGLTHILNAIEYAKTDDKIKGIVLSNAQNSLGMAQLKSLRDKLRTFKESGKFVVSYADTYTQQQYYLASVADTIYLNPVGEVDFKGLYTELLFMKDLQEKSGVKMEVIRHGKYKSAVEPYLENKMSEENRYQIKQLVTSMWDIFTTDVSQDRNIPVDQLNKIATEWGARNPKLAIENNIVDKVDYEDVFEEGIRKALGVDKDEKINSVELTDYVQYTLNKVNKKSDNRVAVIYAEGAIMPGEGSVKSIGEGYMRASLREAIKDDKIKAIVIRINSPGGSALTSDIIWREIELAKMKKPVVVSMGNVAASGGYYIACNANRIFAEPTTVTGSIGVFGSIPNFKNLTDRIGVYSDTVTTHKNAVTYSPFREMSDNFREKTTESINLVYDTFLDRVSKGRGMTVEEVHQIAQGRVWTGVQAKEIGLVDEIGGLEQALVYAMQLAGIEDYRVKNFPVFEKNLEDFFYENTVYPLAKARVDLIKEEIGIENYNLLNQIKDMNNRQGLQLLMPYQIIIK